MNLMADCGAANAFGLDSKLTSFALFACKPLCKVNSCRELFWDRQVLETFGV